MNSTEKKPVTDTVADDATKPADSAEPPPAEKPLDPKEEARRRSKEDLARKRRNLRGRGGRF